MILHGLQKKLVAVDSEAQVLRAERVAVAEEMEKQVEMEERAGAAAGRSQSQPDCRWSLLLPHNLRLVGCRQPGGARQQHAS